MSISIRPAEAADQKIINCMVRSSGINPFGLHWSHFLVAEEQNQIVGVGQVKNQGKDVRLLASLAVASGRRGEGIGSLLVRELLARENGVVYLFCNGTLERYYRRFGFVPVEGGAVPRPLAGRLRLAVILGPLFSIISRRTIRIITMTRQ